MHRSYPNKLPAFQLCSWVGSGTVDLELACLKKKTSVGMIDSSIRQVNSLFTINAMIQPKKSITLTQSQQMHFSQICHEKNSQSVLHSKLAAPKKSPKCSPNFSPSFSFGWRWTKAQTCEAAMDTGPVRRHKNSAPQRHAVGLKGSTQPCDTATYGIRYQATHLGVQCCSAHTKLWPQQHFRKFQKSSLQNMCFMIHFKNASLKNKILVSTFNTLKQPR